MLKFKKCDVCKKEEKQPKLRKFSKKEVMNCRIIEKHNKSFSRVIKNSWIDNSLSGLYNFDFQKRKAWLCRDCYKLIKEAKKNE